MTKRRRRERGRGSKDERDSRKGCCTQPGVRQKCAGEKTNKRNTDEGMRNERGYPRFGPRNNHREGINHNGGGHKAERSWRRKQ